MNKQIYTKTTVSVLLFFFVALIIFNSCKASRSVREIKAKRESDPSLLVGTIPSVKTSEVPKEALTKPLFFQSKSFNIELPHQDGESAGVVSEQVTFINEEKIEKTANDTANKQIDLNAVQHLSEVVVTARSRFAPERNGRVNVDFLIKIPKELQSSDWRVQFSPKLYHNDSIIELQPVILKGQYFHNKQVQDHQNYQDYLSSIIKKSDYDSVFLDHEGINNDIKERQKFFYDEYYKVWSKVISYDKWKISQSGLSAVEVAKLKGIRNKVYNEYARKANEQTVRYLAQGKDTTGIYARNMKDYEAKTKRMVMIEMGMKDKLGKTPSKFQEFLKSGYSVDDIINNVVTANDSTQIVQYRYMQDKIAINEMKEERKDDVRAEMIPFPFEKNVRIDTIPDLSKDFIYLYTQDYPVMPGLKKLRITVDGLVEAVDRSRFVLPMPDTLSYFISSLSQLVDTSLIYKRTVLHRDVFNSMAIYPKFAPNKAVFNINFKDNKAQIDKVIDTYNTFADKGNFVIDSVMLRLATSLDGEYEKNIELTMKRADALRDYFIKAMPETDAASQFKIRYIGEDWNGLVSHLKKRSDIANRDSILNMLANAVNPDQTELQIKKEYAADYKIIYDSIYPQLQKADVVFNMHRPNMNEESTLDVHERPGYDQALKFLQDREYWKALDILADYPDYNTALCLVCMGYNNKAFELLEKLDINVNTEYLRAILAIRSNDTEAAIQYLTKACELEPSRAYRIPLDPEVSDFVKTNNLEFIR